MTVITIIYMLYRDSGIRERGILALDIYSMLVGAFSTVSRVEKSNNNIACKVLVNFNVHALPQRHTFIVYVNCVDSQINVFAESLCICNINILTALQYQ